MLANTRLIKVLEKIDELNAQDPNLESTDARLTAKELLYGHRMTLWLEKIAPDASDILQIAARGQHIQRWKIPRSDYPMDAHGYKQWRSDLAKFHSSLVSQVMHDSGYDKIASERVDAILLKRQLKTNLDTQTIEDVACLVFLDFYFDEFAKKYDDDKLINIIKKTWKKMSELGHKHALTLALSPRAQSLIEKALT